MKRFLLLAVLALAGFTAVRAAAGDTPIQVAQMPAASQNFIKKYFGDIQVDHAVVKDRGLKKYEVVFVNGTEIEFDAQGEWMEVDCEHGAVPEAIIPRKLLTYVEKNHPGRRIVTIKRDTRGYGIELDNDLDLKFDRDFRLMKMDD